MIPYKHNKKYQKKINNLKITKIQKTLIKNMNKIICQIYHHILMKFKKCEFEFFYNNQLNLFL